MALYIVSTPIGNISDITQRSLEVLKNCPYIICESTKETSKLLKHYGIKNKEYRLLNEHSKKEDVEELILLCAKEEVALVSDAGTPNFCDPGQSLIKKCHEKNIPYFSSPGVCSLSVFLSLINRPYWPFLFHGFLSNKTEIRRKELLKIKQEKYPVIIMDTPYRLPILIKDLAELLPNRKIILGLSLSLKDEKMIYAYPKELLKTEIPKQNFIMYIDKG